MQLYFAYGSNINLERIDERCGAKPYSKAKLRGYRMVFKGNKNGVADIIKSKDKCVIGALYEVNDEMLRELDKYEGAPHKYKRIIVDVEREDGMVCRAVAYKMVKGIPVALPKEEYYSIIKEGYEEWELDTNELFMSLIYTTALVYEA